MVEKGAITGHFIAHWGVPSEIYPRDVHGLEWFAILEFPPRGTRLTWRYATNGMSTVSQSYPDPKIAARTELYASTQEGASWVHELLAAMATYPKEHDTYFAQWDTVNAGGPIDRARSPYSGILLVPPAPPDPPTLGLIGGIPDYVLVHQLIGLLPNEVQHAECTHGKVVWEQIAKTGACLLDVKRASTT